VYTYTILSAQSDCVLEAELHFCGNGLLQQHLQCAD
jgi:hypothetical protein